MYSLAWCDESFITPQLSKLTMFLTCFPCYCFFTPCCTSCTTITFLLPFFPLQHGDLHLYNLLPPYSPIFLLYVCCFFFFPGFSRMHTGRKDRMITKPWIPYEEQITARDLSIKASVPLIYHPTPSFLLLTPTAMAIPSQQSLQRKSLTFTFPSKACSKLWCSITRFC